MKNLIEASIKFRGRFWNVFHVLHRFSSILNKVIQPKIYAYCYVIETISRLYLALQFTHNNLIFFNLDSPQL